MQMTNFTIYGQKQLEIIVRDEYGNKFSGAKITSKTELTEFVDKVNFPSHAYP
jgi:hypothetical protein